MRDSALMLRRITDRRKGARAPLDSRVRGSDGLSVVLPHAYAISRPSSSAKAGDPVRDSALMLRRITDRRKGARAPLDSRLRGSDGLSVVLLHTYTIFIRHPPPHVRKFLPSVNPHAYAISRPSSSAKAEDPVTTANQPNTPHPQVPQGNHVKLSAKPRLRMVR